MIGGLDLVEAFWDWSSDVREVSIETGDLSTLNAIELSKQVLGHIAASCKSASLRGGSTISTLGAGVSEGGQSKFLSVI